MTITICNPECGASRNARDDPPVSKPESHQLSEERPRRVKGWSTLAIGGDDPAPNSSVRRALLCRTSGLGDPKWTDDDSS